MGLLFLLLRLFFLILLFLTISILFAGALGGGGRCSELGEIVVLLLVNRVLIVKVLSLAT